jgi:hypothetical protein
MRIKNILSIMALLSMSGICFAPEGKEESYIANHVNRYAHVVESMNYNPLVESYMKPIIQQSLREIGDPTIKKGPVPKKKYVKSQKNK